MQTLPCAASPHGRRPVLECSTGYGRGSKRRSPVRTTASSTAEIAVAARPPINEQCKQCVLTSHMLDRPPPPTHTHTASYMLDLGPQPLCEERRYAWSGQHIAHSRIGGTRDDHEFTALWSHTGRQRAAMSGSSTDDHHPSIPGRSLMPRTTCHQPGPNQTGI